MGRKKAGRRQQTADSGQKKDLLFAESLLHAASWRLPADKTGQTG